MMLKQQVMPPAQCASQRALFAGSCRVMAAPDQASILQRKKVMKTYIITILALVFLAIGVANSFAGENTIKKEVKTS